MKFYKKLLISMLTLSLVGSLTACSRKTDRTNPAVSENFNSTEGVMTDDKDNYNANENGGVSDNAVINHYEEETIPSVQTRFNSGFTSKFLANSSGSGLTLDAAVKIALTDADLLSGKITFHEKTEDTENGRGIYEIKFTAGGNRYEYEIDKETGTILEAKVNFRETRPQQKDGGINEDTAKQIALSHAGVGEEDVNYITVKYDEGNYDVKFYKDDIKYSYEINVLSGQILEFERERDILKY